MRQWKIVILSSVSNIWPLQLPRSCTQECSCAWRKNIQKKLLKKVLCVGGSGHQSDLLTFGGHKERGRWCFAQRCQTPHQQHGTYLRHRTVGHTSPGRRREKKLGWLTRWCPARTTGNRLQRLKMSNFLSTQLVLRAPFGPKIEQRNNNAQTVSHLTLTRPQESVSQETLLVSWEGLARETKKKCSSVSIWKV